MENFAHTAQVRAQIVAGRQECAAYFWRGIASLFARRAQP